MYYSLYYEYLYEGNPNFSAVYTDFVIWICNNSWVYFTVITSYFIFANILIETPSQLHVTEMEVRVSLMCVSSSWEFRLMSHSSVFCSSVDWWGKKSQSATMCLDDILHLFAFAILQLHWLYYYYYYLPHFSTVYIISICNIFIYTLSFKSWLVRLKEVKSTV